MIVWPPVVQLSRISYLHLIRFSDHNICAVCFKIGLSDTLSVFAVGSGDGGIFQGGIRSYSLEALAIYHLKFSGLAHVPSLPLKLHQRLHSLHNTQQTTCRIFDIGRKLSFAAINLKHVCRVEGPRSTASCVQTENINMAEIILLNSQL